MEGYYIIYINDILIIFSFKGRYFLLSYNGKFEKYPPYPPLRVSEGEFGILLGRLFAGGIRLFRFSRQQVLYLFGSALHHHPIVCVGGLYLPEAQLAHGTAHLLETQPQRGVAETTDDLAAGGIDSPFQPHGLAVVGQDQFVLRTGHLKLLHMAAQLLDLFIGKPVTEIYILVECVRLAVDALVGDVRLPRAVYVLHLEGQPSPVPRVIGEELEVVPGGYERGYMGQVHLVASVGSALVHVALRHHRLQLVQLRGGHGVDLLQIDHQVLGHGEQVVLGHAARVALCGVIFGQYGRQNMLHERGLVTALPPYQGEDHLVHHGLVQGGGNHGHHPPFQDVGKADGSFGEVVPFPAFVLLQRTVRTFLDMHHGGQPADVVGLSVPGRQTVQILSQRMIFLDEITAEQRMQLVQVDRHAMVLHGAPQGVLDVVGEPLPVASGLWGLRCGNKITVLPQYREVFDLCADRAAVRFEDGRTGVVDKSGVLMVVTDRCRRLRFLKGELLSVTKEDGSDCYTDLKTNRTYQERPVVFSYGGIELLRVGETFHSRTRKAYASMHGLHKDSLCFYGFYLKIPDYRVPKSCRLVNPVWSTIFDVFACVLEGDDEEVYWCCGCLADRSIVVMDGEGNYYHVEKGKGKRYIACNAPKAGEADFASVVEGLRKEAGRRAESVQRERQQNEEEKRRKRLEEIKDVLPFRMGMKWGLKWGDRIVVPPCYRNICIPVGGYCAFEGNACQWGVMALDGKVVVEARYQKVEIEKDGTVHLTIIPGKVKTINL